VSVCVHSVCLCMCMRVCVCVRERECVREEKSTEEFVCGVAVKSLYARSRPTYDCRYEKRPIKETNVYEKKPMSLKRDL